MSKRIFKSDEYQNTFDRQGFIALPFIDRGEVKHLNEVFDRLHPDLNQGGFYSGSYSHDLNYKQEASRAIVETFSRAYEKYFTDYQPFGGAFLFKVPSEESDLAIHQDWTIVDEEENLALNCWVPLQDINEQNGALHIVPGSHYDKYHSLRSPTLPFFFSGNDKDAVKAAIPMYVRAGTAVILNQSVIHGSVANRSSAIRKAITAGVKSKGAQMYFHYKIPGEDKLEVFKMDDSFLISFKNFFEDIGKRPYLGESVGFKPYVNPILDQSTLRRTLEQLTADAGFPYRFTVEDRQNLISRFFQKVKNLIPS